MGNLSEAKFQEEAYLSIRGYVIDAQRQVYTSVNAAMVTAYWNIGKVVYEACGENGRAAYGKQVLDYISGKLTAEFGKRFTVRNLRHMRQFYLMFPKRHTLCAELSWSHYRLLMRVEDENARTFYAEESAKAGWSVRQLQRQINTMFYQRILASRDKESVAAEIETTVPRPEYDLKCFVLIDLKTEDLTHQDIGQMQMYVNYYTREMMNEGDNPPIGILLCADKSDTLVRYTLPEDNAQIYAAKYMPYMPTEEELRRELDRKDFEKLET